MENIENIIWWVASTGDSLWEWHQKWALLAAHQELLKLPILGSVVPAVPHHQFQQSWEQYRWKAQGLKFVTGKQMTSASGAGWVPEYQLLKSYGAGWRHLKYLSHHNIMATSQSQLSRAIPKPITMVCCSINGLVPENWNRNPPRVLQEHLGLWWSCSLQSIEKTPDPAKNQATQSPGTSTLKVLRSCCDTLPVLRLLPWSMCQSFRTGQHNRISQGWKHVYPFQTSNRKTRAATGSTTCLQLVAPARHSHLNPQVTLDPETPWTDAVTQWIICHVPRSMENHGKASQFLPNTTGRRWIKRGVVHPNSNPHEGGKIRRHVTEQVVREGRPRFPIFKSSAVLLSKTQQALPLLARCALS